MRSATSTDVVFLAAKRTPFGTYGGSLKDLSATDLGVHAAKAALAQADVSPEHVGHVVFGNVAQTSSDAIYLARHVGLRAGAPVSTPALTVNRLCGSGFEAVVQGARLLAGGEAELVLVGGTESMSQAPLVLRGTRWGWPLGKPPPMEDMLWSALTDSYAGLPMAMTAEKLAEQYRIGQDEVDDYSVLSQKRFAAAQEGGRLAEELAPVELATRKGPVMFGRDEHPRPETTVEALRKLPKVFKKDGVVHAGAARQLGLRRRRSDHHGHRAGGGLPEHARPRPGEALRVRPLRGERGLRAAIPGGREGARAAARPYERRRRCHRRRPSPRGERRPH